MQNDLIRQRIREQYEEFSTAERRAADYVLYYDGDELPSSGVIAKELFISEAALTRFAKRCGFHGFRELRFSFISIPHVKPETKSDPATERIVNSYGSLIGRTFDVIDETLLSQIAAKMLAADKILICGLGHSGIAALEYRMRLLRIGLPAEVAREGHMIRIMSSLMTEKSLLIALSISGNTKEITQALKIAKSKAAETVLVTAAKDPEGAANSNIILHTGTVRNLAAGIAVSPQLPLLIVFDLLYAELIHQNYQNAMSAHSATLSALGVKSQVPHLRLLP